MGKRYWAGNFYRSKILHVLDQAKSEYRMVKSHLIVLKEDFSARIILAGWDALNPGPKSLEHRQNFLILTPEWIDIFLLDFSRCKLGYCGHLHLVSWTMGMAF